MRFHYPSFMSSLFDRFENVQGGERLACMSHHWTVYLYPPGHVRQDWLVEIITEAVIDSYESPLWTPVQTEQKSLLKGLLEPHERALRQALQRTDKQTGHAPYIKHFRNTGEGGEVVGHEYRIDVKEIQDICISTLLDVDTHLVKRVAWHEDTVSVRKTVKVIASRYGKIYNNERVRQILKTLEKEGLFNRNGDVRVNGRHVIHDNF